MAILVTGLIMSRVIRADFMGADRHFVHRFWELNAYLANALVFLLMGATITLEMFTERWLAMLIGIVGVLAARVLGVFGVVPLISLTPGVERISLGYQASIVWGGLRGAVTLALALALPVDLDYWWTLQSIAFGVVLFTLFIQGPSMPPLLRRLNLANDD